MSIDRFEQMDPACLKEGDLVEAVVGFVAYPMNPMEHKLVLCLRALSLVSLEWREVRSGVFPLLITD
jgi:hypothetical protein